MKPKTTEEIAQKLKEYGEDNKGFYAMHDVIRQIAKGLAILLEEKTND